MKAKTFSKRSGIKRMRSTTKRRGSKRTKRMRSQTKRRIRGGAVEPTPNEDLQLNVYYEYYGRYGVESEKTRNYKVKFIQKIESKTRATIKGKEVANNTDNAVYIVQIYNLKDIIKKTPLLIELFPFELVPGTGSSDIGLQYEIKDDDYFPVFPGHNLKLLRKKGFFSKDEIIVSPSNDKFGANNYINLKAKLYTRAEMDIFKVLHELESTPAPPA